MKKGKTMRNFFTLLLISLFFASCATSSGSLLSVLLEGSQPEVNEDSRPGEATGTGTAVGAEESEPGLYIRSYPSGANVFINGSFVGTTPLELTELRSGRYRIVIEKEGYYNQSQAVTYNFPSEIELTYNLEPITGYVEVRGIPSDADVQLDGQSISANLREEFIIGPHTLRVRLFGFKEYVETVYIEENQTTLVNVTLEKARFEINNLNVWRERLNPLNPGPLGRSPIHFEVTAPGQGTVKILDDEGNEVESFPVGPFTTWNQEVVWDGKDSRGRMVPEGVYTVSLDAQGDDGYNGSYTDTIDIDYSAVIRFRSMSSGIPGSMYAGGGDLLPQGSFQFDASIIGTQAPGIGGFFPTQVAFRFTLIEEWEFGLQFTGYPTVFPNATSSTAQSYGIHMRKAMISDDNFKAAFAVKVNGGNLGSEDFLTGDPLTNFPGLSLSTPISLGGRGPVTFMFQPDYHMAWKRPGYGDSLDDNRFHNWMYFRAGIVYDSEPLSLALSGAMRTQDLIQGWSLDWPLAVGLEFNFMIPNTIILLNGKLATEVVTYDPNTGSATYYLMGGVGFGIIY
jgi:hypothetical protein